MSDHDLTPAQEESVRALLAAAKHARPAPDDVVARLDDTLASLVAERREVRAPVVTLASRRRRRAAGAMLAAAAVVVLGVGVTQVLPSPGVGGQDDSTASSAESSDQLSPKLDQAPGAGQDGPADSNLESAEARAAEPKTSEHDSLLADPAYESALTSKAPLRPQLRRLMLLHAVSSHLAPTCVSIDAGGATEVAITFDEMPGAAVYREPVAGRQRVDVYLCGSDEPLRTVRLRLR